MRYWEPTARNVSADGLFAQVYGAEHPDFPDLWGRGKFSLLTAWEVRRHRDAAIPDGPYLIRVVEQDAAPSSPGVYAVTPCHAADLTCRTLADAIERLEWYERLAHEHDGILPDPLPSWPYRPTLAEAFDGALRDAIDKTLPLPEARRAELARAMRRNTPGPTRSQRRRKARKAKLLADAIERLEWYERLADGGPAALRAMVERGPS